MYVYHVFKLACLFRIEKMIRLKRAKLNWVVTGGYRYQGLPLQTVFRDQEVLITSGKSFIAKSQVLCQHKFLLGSVI